MLPLCDTITLICCRSIVALPMSSVELLRWLISSMSRVNDRTVLSDLSGSVLGWSILIVANPMRTNTKKKANLNEKSVKFLFFLKRETANKSIAIMPIIKEKDAA